MRLFLATVPSCMLARDFIRQLLVIPVVCCVGLQDLRQGGRPERQPGPGPAEPAGLAGPAALLPPSAVSAPVATGASTSGLWHTPPTSWSGVTGVAPPPVYCCPWPCSSPAQPFPNISKLQLPRQELNGSSSLRLAHHISDQRGPSRWVSRALQHCSLRRQRHQHDDTQVNKSL